VNFDRFIRCLLFSSRTVESSTILYFSLAVVFGGDVTIITVDGEKRLGPMRWGFVSPTAKEPKVAPINARAETLSTSPTLRDAFRRHCLVVADGFYEWRKDDGRTRTPFFIRLKSGRPFGLAGIWSLKRGEKGTRLATCPIATCPPNELMAKIHNRMPVILPVGERDRWLDPATDGAELRGLLVPLPAKELEAYEVSTLVNSPRNDSPECVRPVVACIR
jgi:putative SOS response-associated peptidase YedK